MDGGVYIIIYVQKMQINYFKFEKELYIWTEKYGWKSKSMCRGMIKPTNLLSLLNVHFNNLINSNKTNLNNLLKKIKFIDY